MDTELIERWKKKRDYSAYQQLKNRHRGMVFKKVNTYSSAPVPVPALEAEAWKLFDDAVNSYDPKKGAKFSTHLNYQLRKLDRFVKKYQNVARIPENVSSKIGDYDRTVNTLSKQFNRQPTHKEVSTHMKIPLKHVKQIHTSRRGDLFEGKSEFDTLQTGADTDWLLRELRDELNPQEREVYDHLIGYKKRKYTNKKLLAQKLGMSPGRLSQITRSISEKIGPQLRKRL